MCSFTGVLKQLDPSTTEDVQAYRTWMDRRTPIDPAETRFLAREQDLVVVSRTSAAASTSPVAAQQHSAAAVWFPLTLTLPLVAFAMVPSLLGRLVVLALAGSVALWMVAVTAELAAFMSRQEWAVAAVAYVTLFLVSLWLARTHTHSLASSMAVVGNVRRIGRLHTCRCGLLSACVFCRRKKLMHDRYLGIMSLLAGLAR